METIKFTNEIYNILTIINKKLWIKKDEDLQNANISLEKITQVLEFLEYSKFIKYDATREKIKITELGAMVLNLPSEK
jgi:predicted transcriptional regulator